MTKKFLKKDMKKDKKKRQKDKFVFKIYEIKKKRNSLCIVK